MSEALERKLDQVLEKQTNSETKVDRLTHEVVKQVEGTEERCQQLERIVIGDKANRGLIKRQELMEKIVVGDPTSNPPVEGLATTVGRHQDGYRLVRKILIAVILAAASALGTALIHLYGLVSGAGH